MTEIAKSKEGRACSVLVENILLTDFLLYLCIVKLCSLSTPTLIVKNYIADCSV